MHRVRSCDASQWYSNLPWLPRHQQLVKTVRHASLSALSKLIVFAGADLALHLRINSQNARRYETLSAGAETVESQLRGSLVEHLNAELALGTVRDVGRAMQWLQETFLYVRVPAITNCLFPTFMPFFKHVLCLSTHACLLQVASHARVYD